MPLVHLLQRYRCLTLIETRHETPTLAFGHETLTTLLKVGIERGHLVPEVLERTVEELLRDEKVLLHIILLDGITRLASKDHELTYHILTTEVDTWVGLAIPLLLGQADGIAQLDIFADSIEDKVKRTAHHGLDTQNLVTTIDKVIDGVDDGQTSTYVSFEEVLHTTTASSLLQGLIVLILR